eukprot:CAMPEP_0115849388 /NCGR_PEP_ID=MMETSP0287-20121206/11425_1 /TAXON_ID=412157 /ORGANISM="Chrysochromulina rotalis, Strain UIO044" /LENGTH=218 /DNA_ID=CAMNT_0003303357 /DNA_START=12 /DNA_END=668 /DNA_ORIENTATION=+
MARLLQLTTCASLLAATEAFAPAPAGASRTGARAVRTTMPVCESTDEAIFSRRAVLAGVAGSVIGLGSKPSFAGYVTSLGIETTTPKDADIDDELLATKSVQDALGALKGYKEAAVSLKSQFNANTDAVLIPSIRKDFDFSKLRDSLNVASTVFDDTTQLTIDRLSRGILYDLTELENASRFKKGETETRTPKKVANVDKWFVKLDADLTTFLTYFPK